MPQLDKVHFFSQYFWLCVFYFGFYFLVAKHFLPRMARILQFRKNKLSYTPQDSQDKELNLVKESGNTALENVFSTSHKFWSHNTKRMDEWYGDKVYNLNNDYLKECNNLYIKKVGLYSLSQSAAFAGIELARPSACYVSFLTQKLRQPANALTSLTLPSSQNSATQASFSSAAKPQTKKVSKKSASSSLNSPQADRAASQSNNKKVTKAQKPKK